MDGEEEIEHRILQEILQEYVEDIPIWENETYIDKLILDSNVELANLQEELTKAESQLKAKKEEYQKSDIFHIDQRKHEIETIQQSIKQKTENLMNFFDTNQNSIDLYTEYHSINEALSIASVIFQNDATINKTNMKPIFEECERNHYDYLLKLTKDRYEQAISKNRTELYHQLEDYLESLSVLKVNSLTATFLEKNSPLTSKSIEFYSHLDKIIQIDLDWPKNVTEVASKVFTSRFLFHCNNSTINTPVTLVSLVTGLLRTTIQSIFIITNYLEKVQPEAHIFDNLVYSILQCGSDKILSKNDGTCQFYRMLFEQSSILDQWISSLNYYSKDLFVPILFDKCGNEWMHTEYDTISLLAKTSIDTADDFAFTICSALSRLVDLYPSSLTTKQKDAFMNECIIKSEKQITQIFQSAYNDLEYKKASLIANAHLLMSTQLMEIYQIYNASYTVLLNDSTSSKELSASTSVSLSQRIFDMFVQNISNEYWLCDYFVYRNGVVTPELLNSLIVISQPMKIIQKTLNPNLYNNHFIQTLAQAIDTKIYNEVVKRVTWPNYKSIEQFIIDLNALINVLGKEDLRKLRSTKIWLTGKEDDFLNSEIPDDDAGTFTEFGNIVRSKK